MIERTGRMMEKPLRRRARVKKVDGV